MLSITLSAATRRTHDQDSDSKISSAETPKRPARKPSMSTRKGQWDDSIGQDPLEQGTTRIRLDRLGERNSKLPIPHLPQTDADGVSGLICEHKERSGIF
jgi:hypothetical protein